MPRPYTLFTGQWADLPFEEVASLASGWGYDGLEIAVSGDHLDAWRWDEPGYVESKLAVLEKYNLKVWAISNHLKGQAVCDDPIDFRHEAIVGSKVWGDGDPEGVRQRAAEEMKHTARLAKALGVDTVVGFTGSSIWQYVAMFPPVPDKVIDAGYQDFADRWNPILDVFDECGVRFAHEVHPSEIAYDYWTTVRTLEAIGHRPAFGLNWDPSHFMWQGIDPVSFIWDFKDRIYHVDCKDTKLRPTGRNTVMGSHLPWGDPRRGWDFVSAGRGDVPWESSFRALTAIGYTGPISVEWEDAGMDRLHGAPEALAALKKFDFPASKPPSTPPSAARTDMPNHNNGTSAGQLRWGILGTGFIAGLQTQDLQEHGFTVQAVGSRSLESASAFAEQYGVATAHGSYESLVADPSVDVVYIATPHPFHHGNALLALNAGKHVLVEKAFTMNAREAQEVFDLAAAKGLVALEAMWSRFLPHMIRLREIIANGTIGEVRKVIASHNQNLPKDPAHRLNDPALGGGALLDLGVYPVSFAIDILGSPETIRASGFHDRNGRRPPNRGDLRVCAGAAGHSRLRTRCCRPQPGRGHRVGRVDRRRTHLVQPHALHRF